MANFTKPIEVPNWASDEVNNTNPGPAKKGLGWVFGEEPSSAFENYIKNLYGDWFAWIDERFSDGVDADELYIIDPSGVVGDMVGISNSLLYWQSAAGVEFECATGRVTAGRGATNGINMFGVGDLKGITFDSSFHQIRYRVSTSTFSLLCGSAASSLDVSDISVRSFVQLIASAGIVASIGEDIEVSGNGKFMHGNKTFLFSSINAEGGTFNSGGGYRSMPGGSTIVIPLDIPSGVLISSVDIRYRHSVTGVGSPLVFSVKGSDAGVVTLLNAGQESQPSPVAALWTGHNSSGLAITTGGNSQYYIEVANVSGTTDVGSVKVVWSQP